MLLKSMIKSFVLSASLLLSSFAISAANDEIAERISPVSSLCMAGDACASAPVVVAAGPRSGEEVYKSKCVACHSTGAAGAPKFGDAGAWAPRLAKGTDELYTNALKGFKGMPPKGLCMDCSDDEIKASVDYMIANSK